MVAPIYNLEIRRDNASQAHPQHQDETTLFVGEFIVYNSGRLVRGKNPNLHTSSADIARSSNHIHFDGGVPVNISTENNEPHLAGQFSGPPRFRLDGFYSIRKHSSAEKPSMLIEEIRKFNLSFKFNSAAAHEKTRTKLLENAYRKYVSDQ